LPAVLNLKPEEVDSVEKRGTYRVCVVGCGLRGISYALAFAEAGYKVICADADQSVVKRLSKGVAQLGNREVEGRLRSFVRAGQLNATNELKSAVSQSDIVILAVSAKIDAKKNADYAEVENTCKQVGAALSRGSLVVYGGIAGFGFIEGVVKEALENTSGFKAGEALGLAYNPMQDSVTQDMKLVGEQELKIAADDKLSLSSAAVIFGTIAKKGVKIFPSVRMAELAALLAAAKRDAGVALANELAVFCEHAGVDYAEVLKLLDGDACESSCSPTIAEENSRDEAYLLLESAENLNVKLRLSKLVRQINEDMVKHAVNLMHEALRRNDRTLGRARVALLGTVKSGTAASVLIQMLAAKGAKVSLYDPAGSGNEDVEIARSLRRTLSEAVEGADCVVFLNGHEQLRRLSLKRLRALMRTPAALVDLAGIIDPSSAEEEGFTYRGLGRGVWKK